MNKENIRTQKISDNDKLILQQISELIQRAPSYWTDVVKGKMKVTTTAVYYYSKGLRGMRKGCHKEVLRILIELIEKENKAAAKLSEESQALIDKMNTNQ
jgi:hypothetical protein